ncbi:hypothetical protein [Mesorhizobium sp. M0909]|uniref:hypothetical protein n=1 Tax=Mesorhizobium sp. M0909 TaxID=2957024 RepID=UPI00333C4CD0
MSEQMIGAKKYAFEESTSALTLEELDEPLTGLSVDLVDLPGRPSDGASPKAIVEARSNGKTNARLVFEWTDGMSSFRAGFFSRNDFVSLHYHDLTSRVCPVSVETRLANFAGVVDPMEKSFSGNIPEEVTNTITSALKEFEGLRDPLSALANSGADGDRAKPRLIFQQAGGTSKEKCDSDRKTGWAAVIGTVLSAGLAISTGGASLGVQIAGMLIAGALGGVGGAKVENEHKECKKKAQ